MRFYSSSLTWPSRWQYALALGVVSVTLLIRFALTPILDDQAVFLLSISVLLLLLVVVKPGPFISAALWGEVPITG